MPEGNPEVFGTSSVSDPERILSEIGDSIIVDASVVCGRAHVLAAYERAMRNMERSTAKGSSPATEFFRQISGERQVSAAIKRCRIREGSRAVIITHEPDILRRLGLEAEDITGCDGEHCEDECMEKSALVEIL